MRKQHAHPVHAGGTAEAGPRSKLGEAGTIRHDEKTAHRGVHLIGMELEGGSKLCLKSHFELSQHFYLQGGSTSDLVRAVYEVETRRPNITQKRTACGRFRCQGPVKNV